jgi:hypothetical protein
MITDFDFSSDSAQRPSYCVPEHSNHVTQEACIRREFREFLQNQVSCTAGYNQNIKFLV